MNRPHFTMKFLRRCPRIAVRCLPRAGVFLCAVGLLVAGRSQAVNVPPTVILTNPATVFTYVAPVNLTLGASATDSDGTVSKIEFYQGVTKLGEDTNSPFSLVWSNVPPGNYAVRAVATDNEGATNQSGAIAISVIAPGTSVWVAYNDHSPGVGTAPFTTTYDVLGFGPLGGAPLPTGGPLRNVFTGAILAAQVQITTTGETAPGNNPNIPSAGSPFFTNFTGFVDFKGNNDLPSGPDTGPTYGMCTVTTNAWATYIFTNLDPSRRYSFKGAVTRGVAAYTNRWTLVELLGASSFVSAHSTGVLTTVQAPADLDINQAAANFGYNARGDIINWENIDPGPDGSFSVRNTRYVGFVPNGSSTNGNSPYAYTMTEIRLQEFTASADQPVLLNARKLTNGNFQLTLTGTIGQKYAIDRSLNLSAWTNLVTFTNLAAQTLLTDTNAAGVSARFYRGRLVP